LHDTTVSDEPADDLPDAALRAVFRRLLRFGQFLEPHDHAGLRVSMSDVMALGELAAVEDMSQQELAERMGLEKSTVSRLAAALDERGWLTRTRDPANRRLYRLRLTETGRGAAEQVGRHLHEHHAHLLSLLTEQERTALIVGLRGLARVLEISGHASGTDAATGTSRSAEA
jgi:DNA-binding MarR family transcriptional regulator